MKVIKTKRRFKQILKLTYEMACLNLYFVMLFKKVINSLYSFINCNSIEDLKL